MIARGVRPPDIDLGRARDPFLHIRFARQCLDDLRVYLADRPTWREDFARDDRLRDAALDELAGVGAMLARLTVLVESCGSADPELFLDLVDRADELAALRVDLADRRAPRPGPARGVPPAPDPGAATHDGAGSS